MMRVHVVEALTNAYTTKYLVVLRAKRERYVIRE
jgi:hypothetical protein